MLRCSREQTSVTIVGMLLFPNGDMVLKSVCRDEPVLKRTK